MYVCRPAGTLSVPGVYGGLLDKLPFGAVMNKGLTIRTGQTHVNRWSDDLLRRIHDEVPAIQRLRFVTSFPRDFGDDLVHVRLTETDEVDEVVLEHAAAGVATAAVHAEADRSA